MSRPEFITLDEFDGTHGYVQTKGFVNWIIDLPCHKPRQKVILGDSSLGDVKRPCVVASDDIYLEKGCGYRFGGVDYVYEDREEIQLYLGDSGWARKFYDPAES